MKRRNAILVGEWVVIALCAVSVAAFEQGGRGANAGYAGEVPAHALLRVLNSPEMIEKLGLTSEQVDKLKEKLMAFQKDEVKLRSEQELASLDQAELLTKSEVDEKAVMQAVERLGKLRTEMAKLQMKRLILVKQSLTAEQKEKLRAMIKARRQQQRGGGEMRPGARRNQGMRRNAMSEQGKPSGNNAPAVAPPAPPQEAQ